uniref:Lipase n=1 Tax=Monodelphis domestica TaxID=13616 RepID=F7DNS0_MONDO
MWSLVMATFMIKALEKELIFHDLESSVNPEVLLNASEVIRYWKYPLEEHEVVTADSYVLTLQRIPCGRAGQRPVMLLQHGLWSSSVSWVSNPPNNSLAFILADAGFDVWMGNSRGNTYSMKHTTLSTSSAEYWAFTFDEMARYDLPASIDHVSKEVSFSLSAFVAFSTSPELALQVKAFYALAPVFYIQHLRSPLVQLLSKIPRPALILGDKDVLPQSDINTFLATKVCNNEINEVIWSGLIFSLFGFGPQNLNKVRLLDTMGFLSFGHKDGYFFSNYYVYSFFLFQFQLLKEVPGTVRAYNWGNTKKNMAHYNQVLFLERNLPTALWSGQKDLLVDPEYVSLLVPQIPNLIYHKILPTYNHLDFIWGINAPQDIYYDIIKMRKETS